MHGPATRRCRWRIGNPAPHSFTTAAHRQYSDGMLTLPEALVALEGREEFLVKRYDGLVCINYLIQIPGSFDGIRREFRGITFDEAGGQIVSLPLHKFFNVGQTEETQYHKLCHLNGKVYEKLDGSMIHFFEWKGDLRASTRMSCDTPQAQEALRLARKLGIVDDIVKDVRRGYTPIFEFVAPHNQIVVEYPRARLVYLHSRCRATGDYDHHPIYPDCAKRYDFAFADLFSHLDGEEFEGYVVVLDNGLWVKAKCDWYLQRHKAVDLLMRPAYRLYEVVFDGLMDDLIAKAPDRHKEKLREIYTEAQLDLLHQTSQVLKVASAIMEVASVGNPGPERLRKDYAWFAKAEHPLIFGSLMTAFDKKDVTPGVKARLLDGYKLKYPNRLFADMDVDG